MNIADAFFYGANSPYAAPAAAPAPQQPIRQAPQPWYMQGRIGQMAPMANAVTNGDGFMASGVPQSVLSSMFKPRPSVPPKQGGPFRIPNEPLIPIGS